MIKLISKKIAREEISNHIMNNKYKSVGYFALAIFFLGLFLLFHSHFANSILTIIGTKINSKPGISAHDISTLHHNIAVYSVMGIALFFLSCSLESILLSSNRHISQLQKTFHMATLITQIAIIFLFGDIILQNWEGKPTTITDFSIRYQAIGGLIAVELIVILDFLYAYKNR